MMMKLHDLKKLGLAALVAVAAAACSDTSSPTMIAFDDDSALAGSATDGFFDPNPLFRVIGPSFDLSSVVTTANGFLTAAADKNGNDHLHAARRKKKLKEDEIETKSIDPEKGGTIDVGKAGMKLVIPAGALPGSEDIEITVVAYAGNFHVYEFLPHGLQFSRPVQVEFDIAEIEKFGKELEKQLEDLEKIAEKCAEKAAEGKKLDGKCTDLTDMWEAYEEDAAWYEAAVGSAGFYGVYFGGDVKGKSGGVQALELFDMTLDDDELWFETTHFSGYAIAM